MISLNLLSPDQKKDLKTKRIYMAIKELVMLALLFAALIGMLLVLAKYFLEEQLVNLIEKNAADIRNSQEINNQILAINKKLSTAKDIQDDFKKWSYLIKQVTELTPAGIYYNNYEIYHREKQLVLTGVAPNRQTLLSLQQALEASPLFASVQLPLSDLIEKENNNFTVKAAIAVDQIP